jgi:hypothetical protein
MRKLAKRATLMAATGMGLTRVAGRYYWYKWG